jgi:hypothetical protein
LLRRQSPKIVSIQRPILWQFDTSKSCSAVYKINLKQAMQEEQTDSTIKQITAIVIAIIAIFGF